MDEKQEETYYLNMNKLVVINNTCTVFATALCVGLMAIGTGSFHCLWGLLLMLNICRVQNKKGD